MAAVVFKPTCSFGLWSLSGFPIWSQTINPAWLSQDSSMSLPDRLDWLSWREILPISMLSSDTVSGKSQWVTSDWQRGAFASHRLSVLIYSGLSRTGQCYVRIKRAFMFNWFSDLKPNFLTPDEQARALYGHQCVVNTRNCEALNCSIIQVQII